MATAKAKICSYGDAEVIESLGQFELTSQQLADHDAQEAFVRLIQTMRRRSIAKGTVTNQSLKVLLTGLNNDPGSTV